MMTTDLYDKQGKVIDKVDLPDRLFARSWNPDLVHQALKVQEANKRQLLAHAKTRSEVSGGGKKPWRQKGTGRARHGSTRSPIWVGGGVTHGPLTEKNFTLKISQKMRQGAIFAVLSQRLKEGEVKIVDSFSIDGPRTKIFAGLLKKFCSGSINRKRINYFHFSLLEPLRENGENSALTHFLTNF